MMPRAAGSRGAASAWLACWATRRRQRPLTAGRWPYSVWCAPATPAVPPSPLLGCDPSYAGLPPSLRVGASWLCHAWRVALWAHAGTCGHMPRAARRAACSLLRGFNGAPPSPLACPAPCLSHRNAASVTQPAYGRRRLGLAAAVLCCCRGSPDPANTRPHLLSRPAGATGLPPLPPACGRPRGEHHRYSR